MERHTRATRRVTRRIAATLGWIPAATWICLLVAYATV